MKSQHNRKLHCSHYLTGKTRRIIRKCPLQLITNISFEKKKKKTHSRSNSYSGQPCRHMRITDRRCLIFVFQLQLPHCAQEKGHSLLVLLVNCTCQPSISSVASRTYFTSLLSRSETPHVELYVVWPRCLYCSTQGTGVVVHLGFRPAVLRGKTTGSFNLCRQAFLYFRGLAFDIICSMQRLLCFDTDCLSRTAVAQWNSHARTVLDFVKIITRNFSQTDPELDRLLVHGMQVPNREWDCGVVAW